MAEVIVIGYPNRVTAENAAAVIAGLQKKRVVQVSGLAVVGREANGKYAVETSGHATRAGAAGGALCGLLFGVILLVPIAGLAVGGLVGAGVGKRSEVGLKNEFIKECRSVLRPGMHAVVVSLSRTTADKAIEALEPYGGEVLRTPRSEDAETELTTALAG